MRKWQVRFQIYRPMTSMPAPSEIVEEVQSNASYALSGKRRKDTNCQFCITSSGEGMFMDRSGTYRLIPGTAFITRNNDPDTAYWYPENARRPWVFLWFSFWGETSASMINDISGRYGHVFGIPLEHPVVQRIASYQKYSNSVRSMSPLEGAKLVVETLAGLVSHLENRQASSPSGEMIRSAQEYVMRNLSHDISIREMAVKLGVSREHLSRIFAKHLGFSLHDYITIEKMKFACQLLLETSLPCKEIAGRTGYGNVISFNRAFRSVVRMTPSELRRSGLMPDFNIARL